VVWIREVPRSLHRRRLAADTPTVADHEAPTVLLFHVITLTDLETPDAEIPTPADPADDDLIAPTDAHDDAPPCRNDQRAWCCRQSCGSGWIRWVRPARRLTDLSASRSGVGRPRVLRVRWK
jgi:hypothetical protein